MTIVAVLEGGLGSQMFGYAYARALALKENAELFLDPSSLGSHRTPRTYQLGFFNIVASLLLPGMEVENPQIVGGNHLSEKFFVEYKDKIRQELTLTVEAESELRAKNGFSFFKTASECESVSLVVRRGDFVTDPEANAFHGVCPLEYYYESIEYMASRLKNPTFFLFSDDIEWVKENLLPQYPHTFVSGNDLVPYEELILASFCKHHVIANSTFAWWGAWLGHNPNKMVCSPRQWTRQPFINMDELLPKGWIMLGKTW